MPFITPAKAAAEYGLHTRTLARYADDGLVEYRRTPGGHRRYDRESLENLLSQEQMQIEIDRAAVRAVLRGAA